MGIIWDNILSFIRINGDNMGLNGGMEFHQQQ